MHLYVMFGHNFNFDDLEALNVCAKLAILLHKFSYLSLLMIFNS